MSIISVNFLPAKIKIKVASFAGFLNDNAGSLFIHFSKFAYMHMKKASSAYHVHPLSVFMLVLFNH